MSEHRFGAPGQVKITPSSDPAIAKTTVTISKDTAGLHRITATADTPAGNPSPSTLPGTDAASGGSEPAE